WRGEEDRAAMVCVCVCVWVCVCVGAQGVVVSGGSRDKRSGSGVVVCVCWCVCVCVCVYLSELLGLGGEDRAAMVFDRCCSPKPWERVCVGEICNENTHTFRHGTIMAPEDTADVWASCDVCSVL